MAPPNAAGRMRDDGRGTLRCACADKSLPHRPQEGWTPLMHAVKNGSAGVFRLLLDHGVDLHVESEVRLACAGGSAAASLLGIAYGSRG